MPADLAAALGLAPEEVETLKLSGAVLAAGGKVKTAKRKRAAEAVSQAEAEEATRAERSAPQPRRPSAASRTIREEGPVLCTFVYWAVLQSILCSRDQ